MRADLLCRPGIFRAVWRRSCQTILGPAAWESASVETFRSIRQRPAWRYLPLLSHQRELGIPSLVATALAIASQVRGPQHPVVWPAANWLFLALGCLVAAQFRLWLKAQRRTVVPEHADKLRNIALNVRDRARQNQAAYYGDNTVRRIFNGHFPDLIRAADAWDSLVQRSSQSEPALHETMVRLAKARLTGANWQPAAAADRVYGFLREWAERVEVPKPNFAHEGPYVGWKGGPNDAVMVFCEVSRQEPESSAEALQALTLLGDWYEAVLDSEAYAQFKALHRERAETREMITDAFEAVMHAEQIGGKCETCSPSQVIGDSDVRLPA